MITEGTRIGVLNWWSGQWRGPTVFVVRDGLLHPQVSAAGREAFDASDVDIELPGTLFARLTDHHVHLGLARPESLLEAGITTVVDLGWNPEQASAWHSASVFPGSTLPEVRIAGAFLSCPGGYPSAAEWAPVGTTLELETTEQAVEAVNAQLATGASVIKVMLNSDAGPVLSDDMVNAIIEAASPHGVPVVAHVQGPGQAARGLAAGVSAFAHAPFTEALDDTLLAQMVRAGLAWVSTIDIHGWGQPTPERAIAIDNVRRFAALGGRVLYGTDLGNGPVPNGVNERELLALAEAGLTPDALVASIATNLHQVPIGPRFAWVPGEPPRHSGTGPSTSTSTEAGSPHDTSSIAMARWLAGARGTTIDYLEETLP